MQSGNNAVPNLPAPVHLSPRSAALWQELVAYRCKSTERRVLLQLALEDLDRADALREQIAHEGAIQVSERSKLARIHAGLKVEAEVRRRFLRTWDMLNLTWGERTF